METIKSVLGLGGSVPPSDPEPGPAQKDLSGQEPISGKQGAGTATDPYDAGNADGQSGSAPGQTPDVPLKDSSSSGFPKDSISSESPKDSTSTESPKDPSASYLKPTEFTTASATPEPSPTPQENTSSYPGLQGHPLPVPEPTPTPFAEDRAPTQVNEQTQTEDTQPQGYISQLPTNTTAADTRENQTGGAGESKPFVEQEAARLAKESEPSPPSNTIGPATSTATSAPDTDHELAESTKKIHLKDKIKDKLHHFRKKTEST